MFESIKNRIQEAWNVHGMEVIVGTTMAAIGFAIVVSLSGDINQAFAHSRGR